MAEVCEYLMATCFGGGDQDFHQHLNLQSIICKEINTSLLLQLYRRKRLFEMTRFSFVFLSAPEECPAGKTNCSLTSTNVAGFDAQGQVCRISGKSLQRRSILLRTMSSYRTLYTWGIYHTCHCNDKCDLYCKGNEFDDEFGMT